MSVTAQWVSLRAFSWPHSLIWCIPQHYKHQGFPFCFAYVLIWEKDKLCLHHKYDSVRSQKGQQLTFLSSANSCNSNAICRESLMYFCSWRAINICTCALMAEELTIWITSFTYAYGPVSTSCILFYFRQPILLQHKVQSFFSLLKSIFTIRHAFSFNSWLHVRINFAIKLGRHGYIEKMNAFTLPSGSRSGWGG